MPPAEDLPSVRITDKVVHPHGTGPLNVRVIEPRRPSRNDFIPVRRTMKLATETHNTSPILAIVSSLESANLSARSKKFVMPPFQGQPVLERH